MNFLKTLINLYKILKKKKIVYLFYSEAKIYQNNFYDLIIELSKKVDDNIYYVSSDIEDKIISKNIVNIYIGKSFIRNFFFYYIKCKFFFITLTDLDNYYLKKSKRVYKYIYIFHSPISLNKSYTPNAFDNYDIFFSIGSMQTHEFLKIFENKKIADSKDIVKVGYFYFDYLKKKINLEKLQKNTVLVAPSWNYSYVNFLTTSCQNLIKCLIDNNFTVILRPHPEHFKRNKDVINKILKIFSNNKNFFFDRDSSNINSISKSEFLITDNSGIAVEYCLISKKPVFYYDSVQKIHNKNYKLISDYTLEDAVKITFGKLIRDDDMEKIKIIVEKHHVFFKNELQNKIDNFIDKYFYNYNNTVNTAINYILNYNK